MQPDNKWSAYLHANVMEIGTDAEGLLDVDAATAGTTSARV
jgi:hypothetical protein